ncbi:hypothetical protein [Sinomonas sp. P47F7]|uniref:hypothetical protein n=1 Tax=Sinomonas sp. P47F7 TaxID=3410987 RepID=UPI003BF59C39
MTAPDPTADEAVLWATGPVELREYHLRKLTPTDFGQSPCWACHGEHDENGDWRHHRACPRIARPNRRPKTTAKEN